MSMETDKQQLKFVLMLLPTISTAFVINLTFYRKLNQSLRVVHHLPIIIFIKLSRKTLLGMETCE